VLLMVGRGRVTTTDDTGNVQRMQVELGADEIIDGVPRLAQYGFQSVPPADADAVVVFIAGERSNGVVIATGDKTYRMRGLASGEVALSDDKGQTIYLSAAGIRIDGGGLPIEIQNTPTVTMAGDLVVDGNITAGGDIADGGGAKTMAGMRSAYDSHRHAGSALPAPLM
jgi:phage gp45-like